MADRDVYVGVLAADDEVAAEIFSYLLPPTLSEQRRRQAGRRIVRVANEADFARCTVGFAERGVPHPENFYRFDPARPAVAVKDALDDNDEDGLALARWFQPFRDELIERTIWKVSKENALFTVATAAPNIIPNVLMVPWAAGEFASDTAFLTMNQVRMAFLLAAASDHDIGYSDQKGQIGSIVAAAFGWRALARQLIGKIPAGGGLVAKGLVAFAGTYAVGKGLEKFFQVGSGLTPDERRRYYDDAFQRGRNAVTEIVDRVRQTRPDSSAADAPAATTRPAHG